MGSFLTPISAGGGKNNDHKELHKAINSTMKNYLQDSKISILLHFLLKINLQLLVAYNTCQLEKVAANKNKGLPVWHGIQQRWQLSKLQSQLSAILFWPIST